MMRWILEIMYDKKKMEATASCMYEDGWLVRGVPAAVNNSCI